MSVCVCLFCVRVLFCGFLFLFFVGCCFGGEGGGGRAGVVVI